MVVDLKPQHTRATLMLVTGVALVAFGGWGMFRPDLFEARALPTLALVTGSFFVAVSVALTRVPRGLDTLQLVEGNVVMTEAGHETTIGLGALKAVHVMREPLGRGHPVVCFETRGGALIEVTPLRYGHLEPMSAAMREDLEVGPDVLPALPQNLPVAVTDDTLELENGETVALAELTAVDFVNHASVDGPGLVLHRGPLESLPDGDMIDAAVVMRRIAEGQHVSLRDVRAGDAVSLALHLDVARTMMEK